jgi:hypothetical protein
MHQARAGLEAVVAAVGVQHAEQSAHLRERLVPRLLDAQ